MQWSSGEVCVQAACVDHGAKILCAFAVVGIRDLCGIRAVRQRRAQAADQVAGQQGHVAAGDREITGFDVGRGRLQAGQRALVVRALVASHSEQL